MNAGELAITHGSALEDPVVAVTGIAIEGDALEADPGLAPQEEDEAAVEVKADHHGSVHDQMKTKSPGHAQNLVVRVVPEAAVKARRDPTKKEVQVQTIHAIKTGMSIKMKKKQLPKRKLTRQPKRNIGPAVPHQYHRMKNIRLMEMMLNNFSAIIFIPSIQIPCCLDFL